MAVAAMLIMGGANMASSLMNSKSQIKNYKYQATMSRKEAANLYEDAANISLANSINEDTLRRQSKMELSLMKAGIKQGGLEGGTLDEVQEKTEIQMEADILLERWNGHTSYIAKKAQADNAVAMADYYGKMAKYTRKYRWANALVGGLSGGTQGYYMGGGESGGKKTTGG